MALQGAVVPHAEKLAKLGAEPVEVRTPADLSGVRGIILPGGESTTMLHLLKLNALWEPLKQFVAARPAWGVCAGAILLAKRVSHPAQDSLEALDIAVERNAYGHQVNSFIAPLEPTQCWRGGTVEGIFIRAPRITAVEGKTEVLFEYKGEPVMVEEGNLLASTFHPELTDDPSLHQYFLDKIGRN